MTTSLLVSFVMLGGKLAAYFLTGSSAIFSDAAESVIHLLATGFAGFSLWYASHPADPEHQYGHGKIAYFSSGIEGLLIFAAAITIMYSAVSDLIHGSELQRLGAGLFIIGGLTLINGILGLYLIRVGRRENALVLVSNGKHVLTDMWTSLGVLFGVTLVWITGVTWLDPAVAILVALNIIWTAGGLLQQAVGGLMERVSEDDSRRIIQTLEEARSEGSIAGFHQVRHRRINDQVWVDYHLQFAPTMSITDAHARSHAVESSVDALFPSDRVYVTAHLEPDEHDIHHPRNFREPEDALGGATHQATSTGHTQPRGGGAQ